MSLFEWYCLFALTTAVVAIYELLHPVIKQRALDVGKVNDKVVLYITFFAIALLTAPALVVSCLMPSAGEKFRSVLYRELFKE